MNRPIAFRTRNAALLPAVLLVTTGCGTTTAVPAGPGRTLQAHVWQCSDGSTIHTRNMASPPSIILRRGTDTRTLPQVRAASGARYQDSVMQFWNKGDRATLECEPGPPVDCREIRSLSLLEDARVRGVTFRGVGNEPGWLLEIGPDHRLMFEDGYGSRRVVFHSLPPRNDSPPGITIHENTSSAQRLKVTLRRENCADTMSDETYPHTVDIEMDGVKRRGCGRPLR
jgi:membrane-bound inhibitor of C-type lysozyme